MGTEIERKFLVNDGMVPPERGMGEPFDQGYLAVTDEVEVRIRRTPSVSTLTVKGGRGLERVEEELEIDGDDFLRLWNLTEGQRIEKRRYRIAIGDLVAELDEYSGALAGLRVVEVEFDDRTEAERFVPPAWFGPELTGIPGWGNAELARNGRPDPPAARS